MVREEIKPAIFTFIVLSVITGIIYPLCITGIAQAIFPRQANGSLIYRGGLPIGSALIGQPFDDPRYFWGRLSATAPYYNASSSAGSNIGPSSPALIEEAEGRIKALHAVDPDNKVPIPVDLVTASASGLDSHVSVAAAYYQIPRIARLRGLTQREVKAIISKHTQGRLLGLIGEPVVNILEANLDLDSYKK